MRMMLNSYDIRNVRIGLFALLTVWAAAAFASIAEPLYVGNLIPVFNEFGRPMPGGNSPAAAAGRSLVEIRTVLVAGQQPAKPDYEGNPNEGLNPLLSSLVDLGEDVSGVGGMGLNASRPHSGIFAMLFPRRPPTGTRLFARVYNAPSIEEASFYADSAVVEVPARGMSLVVTFGPITAMDDRDPDAHGFHNSWRKSLGPDPWNTDTDGDGMSDYDEWLAGTDHTDPLSNLSFRDIRPVLPAALPGMLGAPSEWAMPVHLRWQSVPGRRYQLQHAETLLGEQEFVDVGEVLTAGEGEYEMDMWVDIEDEPTGVFRIRLVTDQD